MVVGLRRILGGRDNGVRSRTGIEVCNHLMTDVAVLKREKALNQVGRILRVSWRERCGQSE